MAKHDISQENVRKMQMVGLKMLKYFDEVCKKNNLTYFFCGGCCIGTIRNKGFVPWDDDVDVFMPRNDYEKLKKVWKDTKDYSIQYTTKDYITENQFLTICDNNTTFIKTYQKDLDINHGVVLDVIPLDGCPKGIKRKMQKMWALLYSLFTEKSIFFMVYLQNENSYMIILSHPQVYGCGNECLNNGKVYVSTGNLREK